MGLLLVRDLWMPYPGGDGGGVAESQSTESSRRMWSEKVEDEAGDVADLEGSGVMTKKCGLASQSE